jgi:hypothetical protein
LAGLRTTPQSGALIGVAGCIGVGILAITLLVVGTWPVLAYTEVPVPNGGTLTGVVRFTGKPVLPSAPSTNKDGEGCADRTPTESLRLGPERSVAGGVILVHGVTRGKKSQLDVVLESRQCTFTPPVIATMAGARARVRNADPLVHSARGVQGKTTIFHVAIPGKEQEVDITRRLTKPGVIRILAERDPHMSAWMVVHDNPYVAVTDAHGAFRIETIPPGAYRVTMWHHGFRRRGTDRAGRLVYEEPHTITKEVAIAPRTTATVAFELR